MGKKKRISFAPRLFFEALRKKFASFVSQIFPNFVFLKEGDLLRDLSSILTTIQREVIVSLDRVYTPLLKDEIGEVFYLDVTRLVNEVGESRGYGARWGTPSIEEQIEKLPSLLKKERKDVVLVDDVIFSGSLVERLVGVFLNEGVRVDCVVAAIGIGGGIERVKRLGVKVLCAHTFDSVVDQVCERDFYPGTPFCGRTLESATENIGVPYLLPWGKPHKWASIPRDKEKEFSIFCIEQTLNLFEAIEKASGRGV